MATRNRKASARKRAKKGAKLLALLKAPEPQAIPDLPGRWSGNGSDTPPGFYVYCLVDPRCRSVFYVGKGQRARAWQHERHVRAGRPPDNASKCARIREVIAAGGRVEVRVEAAYLLESDALEHEWRLIDTLPALTNLMPGGVGAAQTPEQITRRQILRQAKLAEVRRREKELVRQREIDRNAQRLNGIETPEGQEWVEEMKRSGARLTYRRCVTGRRSRAELDAFRASKPA